MKFHQRTNAADRASRRRFTQAAAAALVAAPLSVSLANAQTPNKPKQAPAPPNPQPSPTPSQPSPLAEAYAEVVRVRFGDQITPEQLTQLKKDMDGNVRSADRLRAYKLQNSDEPDFIFNAS